MPEAEPVTISVYQVIHDADAKPLAYLGNHARHLLVTVAWGGDAGWMNMRK